MTTSRGGRPTVGPMISHRMPKGLIERLDAHAETTGTTRSDLLRRAAERLLAEETAMYTITFDSADQATFFADIFAGNTFDRAPEVEGVAVTISSDALAWLAQHHSDEDDGYYDGSQIWIGGYGYRPNAR